MAHLHWRSCLENFDTFRILNVCFMMVFMWVSHYFLIGMTNFKGRRKFKRVLLEFLVCDTCLGCNTRTRDIGIIGLGHTNLRSFWIEHPNTQGGFHSRSMPQNIRREILTLMVCQHPHQHYYRWILTRSVLSASGPTSGWLASWVWRAHPEGLAELEGGIRVKLVLKFKLNWPLFLVFLRQRQKAGVYLYTSRAVKWHWHEEIARVN